MVVLFVPIRDIRRNMKPLYASANCYGKKIFDFSYGKRVWCVCSDGSHPLTNNCNSKNKTNSAQHMYFIKSLSSVLLTTLMYRGTNGFLKGSSYSSFSKGTDTKGRGLLESCTADASVTLTGCLLHDVLGTIGVRVLLPVAHSWSQDRACGDGRDGNGIRDLTKIFW